MPDEQIACMNAPTEDDWAKLEAAVDALLCGFAGDERAPKAAKIREIVALGFPLGWLQSKEGYHYQGVTKTAFFASAVFAMSFNHALEAYGEERALSCESYRQGRRVSHSQCAAQSMKRIKGVEAREQFLNLVMSECSEEG